MSSSGPLPADGDDDKENGAWVAHTNLTQQFKQFNTK